MEKTFVFSEEQQAELNVSLQLSGRLAVPMLQNSHPFCSHLPSVPMNSHRGISSNFIHFHDDSSDYLRVPKIS